MSDAYLLSSPPPYSPQHESMSCLPSVVDSLKKSLRSFTTTSSKVELEILPFDSVDMYGQPDRDSAYSLSGHILVTLVPPSGYFCDTPPSEERFLLDSLVITFEGQSELVTPQTGYTACRLIELSQELVLDEPISISHSWDQDSSRGAARWFVTFNLTVPGWLPPSCHTTFGKQSSEEPEVSYHLSAVAKYREQKPSPSTSWRSTCTGYMRLPTVHTVNASTIDVKVNRYTLPSPRYPLNNNEFPDAQFRSIEYSGTIARDGTSSIPIDILSKLCLRASVPEHIPIDAGVFPLLLKIRPQGLSTEDRKRLRLPGFFVDASQNEVLRSSRSTLYAAKWPVPPTSEQPPLKPLRSRRDDSVAYEFGMALNPPPGTVSDQSYSLLPPGFPGRIEIDGNDASRSHFDNDHLEEEDTWIRIRVDVPFRELFVEERHLSDYKYRAVPKLRPTEHGPILTVGHTLDLALTCSYELPDDGTTALDELKLSIPLSFVRVPRSGPHSPVIESFTAAADCGSPLSATGPAGSVRMQTQRVQLPLPSQPYAQSLPTYNLLYHKDGERREDPTPLPRYAPEGQLPEETPLPDTPVCAQTPPPWPSQKGSLGQS